MPFRDFEAASPIHFQGTIADGGQANDIEP
jgi:hypothetical protein